MAVSEAARLGSADLPVDYELAQEGYAGLVLREVDQAALAAPAPPLQACNHGGCGRRRR
jgi:hypothetical protein